MNETISNETVIIESDTRGRISISAFIENGVGDGYRIAGPKYYEGGGEPLALVTLTGRDVGEIRSYLRRWDRTNLTGEVPSEVLALSTAVDQYLAECARVVTYPDSADLPHNAQRMERSRTALTAAIVAAFALGEAAT